MKTYFRRLFAIPLTLCMLTISTLAAVSPTAAQAASGQTNKIGGYYLDAAYNDPRYVVSTTGVEHDNFYFNDAYMTTVYKIPLDKTKNGGKLGLDVAANYTIDVSADGENYIRAAAAEGGLGVGEFSPGNRCIEAIDIDTYAKGRDFIWVKIGDQTTENGWGGLIYHLYVSYIDYNGDGVADFDYDKTVEKPNPDDKSEIKPDGNNKGNEKPVTVGKVTGLKASKQTSTSIQLSWNEVSGADGYAVLNGSKQIANVKGTFLAVKKLKAATSYTFTVKAVKGNAYGAAATIKTTTAPQKPTLKKPKTAKKSIKLSWKKLTGTNGYEIAYGIGKKPRKFTVKRVNSAKVTAYTVKKLKSQKTYAIKIRAFKKVGSKRIYSAYSKTYTVKVK